MSVTLRKRKNPNGTTSLRLDIYQNGKHSIETLKHLKLVKPTSSADREQNKLRLQQAEEICVNRAAELQANDYGMVTDTGRKTPVVTWMQSYVDGYPKKDKRNMQGALNRFSDLLGKTRRQGLTFGELNALIIEEFIDYLEKTSTGEGPSSYYNRFKKMIRHAYRKRLMKENVLDFVEKKIKGKAKKKDILTLEELKILSNTHTNGFEVKRAFLFTCVTGLRWSDIKGLRWDDIDLSSKKPTVRVRQSKTGEDVIISLNETAIRLLAGVGEAKDLVFNLPTADGANATLKDWVKRAGIKKKITWHNGRHSFGTNLILNDVALLTTSKLLGHTSIKHTQRYVDIVNEMKREGTDKLNFNL